MLWSELELLNAVLHNDLMLAIPLNGYGTAVGVGRYTWVTVSWVSLGMDDCGSKLKIPLFGQVFQVSKLFALTHDVLRRG